MSKWDELTELKNKFIELGMDADDLLSVSDTIEYYFDHGALFKTTNVDGVSVTSGDT